MDLDLQYSPSKWVVRMRPEDVVADHMATTVARAEAAARASGGVVERDLRYGDAPGALLDLYHPPTPPTAVVAYIHGGYWQALGKEHGAHMNGVLAAAGAVTASLGYDLCPSVTIPAMVAEIVQAVRWLQTRFPALPIIVGGHSAGAHLAVAALLELGDSHGVSGVFLLSGVYDLAPIRLAGGVNTDNCLHLTSAQDALDVSPAHQLARPDRQRPAWDRVQAVVAVGSLESDEFRRQSAEFAAQLEPLCRSVKLIVVPGRDHFDVNEVLSDASSSPTDALLALIQQRKPGSH